MTSPLMARGDLVTSSRGDVVASSMGDVVTPSNGDMVTSAQQGAIWRIVRIPTRTENFECLFTFRLKCIL